MHLITMAHFGEAQGVIESLKLKRISPEFYQGENTCLVITGEGPFEAATITARYAQEVKAQNITNLGIAGSLSSEFKVGDFLSIRSIYLVQNEKPLFKTIQVNDSGVDLITSFERILDPAAAEPLRGFGKLVDREAWGVGFAARKAGIPFSCYKLVSDNAGTIEACELVKEKAHEFSEILARAFTKEKEPELNIPGFYFTFSTRHQLSDYLKKLMIKHECSKEQILESCDLDEIRSLEISPKEKTSKLLKRLEAKLDPLKARIESTKSLLIKDFSQKGLKLEIDPQLENPKARISFEVADDSELEEKGQALLKVSLKNFTSLMQGHIDVE